MENVRKHKDIKLVRREKGREKIAFSSNDDKKMQSIDSIEK